MSYPGTDTYTLVLLPRLCATHSQDFSVPLSHVASTIVATSSHKNDRGRPSSGRSRPSIQTYINGPDPMMIPGDLLSSASDECHLA
ncbi:hypothetical protein V6N13_020194 [Hibiscus sabdariffa]